MQYGRRWDTPWGQLKDLDLTDSELCATILAQDKHQLTEGLVVENLFDQIIDAVPASLPGALLLDVETAIVDTGRSPDRWHAFVWARSRTDGLGRYLKALGKRFRTWLVELDVATGTFIAHERREGKATGETQPLPVLMKALANRSPAAVTVAEAVRDQHRQRLGFWGFLSDAYGDKLGERVILPRLFLNHGIQPWFRAVWNLDRILIHGDDIWMLEIKHKYPMSRGALAFGVNDGELGVIRLLGEAGIRCFHAIIVKPQWTAKTGAGYLFNRLAHRERAALIGVELDRIRINGMFDGSRGLSPAHTTFSGEGRIGFRSIPAAQFGRIGWASDMTSSPCCWRRRWAAVRSNR